MAHSDVLIVGAGPTGLVLALWLAKFGCKPRIIDKVAEPGTTSRALAVHARTLELYRQLDLADAVIERGHKVPAVNLWVGGEREVRVSFEDVGADITPYPFLHIFPQDEHERLLISRLQAMDVAVERQTELVHYRDEGNRIVASLHGPAGDTTFEAAYIVGCDGAHSTVRQTMGIGFPGGTYRQVFYVADVEAAGPPVDSELHVDLDEADFLAVFPLARKGHVRLIGTVRDERAEHPESLAFEDVSGRAIEHLKIRVEKVNWFSHYRVHHRVAEHFRVGRAFLLGDAAHIHSPAGGQGMNTGIGDAINLAWKLHAVISGHFPDALLDTYEPERIAFARRLVQTTDRVFAAATAQGWLADVIRTRIAPVLIPAAAKFDALREWLFRTVSQVTINYRDSALSRGEAGRLHGGDRLPWVTDGVLDNYRPLASPVWQAHVYGSPSPELTTWCEGHGLPLHVFPWRPGFMEMGIADGTLYLLRPDTYIALVAPASTTEASPTEALSAYFDSLGTRASNLNRETH